MIERKIIEELVEEGESAGVEAEPELDSESDEYQTTEPFDPDSISITSKVIALDAVLRRIRTGTINLSPDFQRNFVWDKKRKSQLIESMILKIPLPMFYVAEDKKGVWEVVDGLQRLSTIRDFIFGPNFDGQGDVLSDLEFLQVFNNRNYYSIAKDEKAARVQNNIMESQLAFTIINPDTPEKVKRNVFKRINTGGMRLSDQEIRHALYQGKATIVLHALVNTDVYLSATGGSVKDGRMAGRELILRFLAFNLLGRENFRSSMTMDDFLSNAMMYINGTWSPNFEAGSVDRALYDFSIGMHRSVLLFNDHAFRTSTIMDGRKSPINKALFEVWINVLAELEEEHFQNLLIKKEGFTYHYQQLLGDKYFSNSISRYGSSPGGAMVRYSNIQSLVDYMIKVG